MALENKNNKYNMLVLHITGVIKHQDEWNITTKIGSNNINKEDTCMVWANGRRPKKGKVLKIKIIIILKKTFFKNKLF
jgi:hypothetical protein